MESCSSAWPLGTAAPAFAAGDAANGKVLSYTCLGCHGIEDYKNVYPTYSVPELYGQHASYLIAALKEYRSGERSHATMHMQAASLSDQDIEDIAAYFAGPELKPSKPTVGNAAGQGGAAVRRLSWRGWRRHHGRLSDTGRAACRLPRARAAMNTSMAIARTP